MVYDLLLERFLRYVKSIHVVMKMRQERQQHKARWMVSKVLKPELEELGLSNIHYLESNGYS